MCTVYTELKYLMHSISILWEKLPIVSKGRDLIRKALFLLNTFSPAILPISKEKVDYVQLPTNTHHQQSTKSMNFTRTGKKKT